MKKKTLTVTLTRIDLVHVGILQSKSINRGIPIDEIFALGTKDTNVHTELHGEQRLMVKYANINTLECARSSVVMATRRIEAVN